MDFLSAELVRSRVNLPQVLYLAESWNITGLLYGCLRQPQLWPHVPDPARQQLKGRFSADCSLVMAYFDELAKIASAGEAQEIKFMALKGAAWAKVIYPQLGLRPFQDIDLLLRPEHLPLADELMRQHYSPEPLPDDPVRRRCHFHLNYRRNHPLPLCFELHWGLFTPDMMLNLDLEDFWRQAQPLPGFPAVLAPSREYLFLHLCLHFTGHGFLSLRDLWDAAWMIDSQGISWEKTVSLAKNIGMTHRLFWVLDFSRRILGADVPDEVIREISPPDLTRRIFLANYDIPEVLNGMAESRKDLRALILFFLHQGSRKLEYLTRLVYPGICWISIFPDEAISRLKTLLTTWLRGIRLVGFISYRLLFGLIRIGKPQDSESLPV